MNRVISFSSGKGGVGKTTLVANLGHLFAKRGKNTLMVDADWSLGKLGIALGMRPTWTIEQVLNGTISANEAIQGVCENLSMLASPSGVVGLEELNETSRNQLFYELDALRNQYDVVLLDHSSGLNWGVLQFAAASHQHVIVTTPEPTSYTDAYAIMKILSKRFSIREFELVVTMSHQRQETEQVISRFSEVVRSHLDVKVNLLTILPFDDKVGNSIRCQKPYVSLYPEKALTLELTEISKILEKTPSRATGGLRFFYETESLSLLAR